MKFDLIASAERALTQLCAWCRCSRPEGEDPDRGEAGRGSAPPRGPDHPAVRAARLQDGRPEDVAGRLRRKLCVLVFPLSQPPAMPFALKVSEDLLSHHYSQLTSKPFYPKLLGYMTSGPVVVMVRGGREGGWLPTRPHPLR